MKKIIQVLMVAATSVMVSVILIFICAFLAYKLRLSPAQLGIMAMVIYAVGSFIAGFGVGKLKKEKRLLWGICAGVVYFAAVLAISIISGGSIHADGGRLVRCVLICVAAGTIGAVAT